MEERTNRKRREGNETGRGKYKREAESGEEMEEIAQEALQI